MGIVQKYSDGYVKAMVLTFQKRVEAAVLFQLKYLGENLVKYAKDSHNYTDRTGNLTNSMGYAVVRKGDTVSIGGSDQPGEGAEAAVKAAVKMAAKLPNTFSLVIVAGMNYAAYVEAKGYNVILPAELKAKKDFPAAMKRLTEKARNKANQMFGNVI